MAQHNQFGKEAEVFAATYFEKKGYLLLERNWRYLKSEIDLILLKDKTLVIVEVKARQINSLISPESAVNKKKQGLLIHGANAYVIQKKIQLDVQFDILSLQWNGNNWLIKHIENAFSAFDF